MKIINTKQVKPLTLGSRQWLEGIDLNDKQHDPNAYLTKYNRGNFYWWKEADSFIFMFEKGTACISRKYFNKFFEGRLDHVIDYTPDLLEPRKP